jgi:hypothetical protein
MQWLMDSILLTSLLVFVGIIVGLGKLVGGFQPGLSQQKILEQQLCIDTYRFPSSVVNNVTETYPHLFLFQMESMLKVWISQAIQVRSVKDAERD